MLKRIELTDFKSFREATVDFGALTVLVGTNASGESNLKDALRFLHGVGFGYHFSEILGGKSGPSSVLKWRGIRGEVGEIAYDDSTEFKICCDIVPSSKTHRIPSLLEVRPNGRYLRFALWATCGQGIALDPIRLPLGLPCFGRSSDAERSVSDTHPTPARGSYRKHGKVSECSSFLPAVVQLAFDPEAPVGARRACGAVLGELKGIRFLDLDPDAMREPAQLGQSTL